MNREFIINISFLLTINLLVKPFYIFGIDRTIQNRVGAGEYGWYAALFDFTFLFYILNDIGLQQFNNRSIAQHPTLIHRYLPNLLSLKLFLAIIYLLLVFLGAWIIDYPQEIYHLILFIAINQILISLVFFLRTNISGLGFYRTDSIISALDKLVLIGICAFLLWGNWTDEAFQIEWFIWAQSVAWSFTAIVAFLILRKKVRKWHFKVDLNFWKVILKKSYPFAIVFLLMTIYTRLDKVMIERLLSNGPVEAGIYAAGYRLLDASNMIGFLFAGLLLPMFSGMLKRKENVQSLANLSIQMILAGAITVAIACWFFREDIMYWLYDDATFYYGEIMGLLMLSFIAVSGVYIYSTLLTANANLKRMNWLFVISIIINIILNLILIPNQKAYGAAAATLFTQFFVFAGTVFLSKNEMNIKFPLPIFLRILAFTLVLITISNLSLQFLSLPWLVNFLMIISSGILLSFLFRLINIKILLELLANRRQNNP